METKNNKDKNTSQNDFWDEAKENVTEGAKLFSNKVSDYTDKISNAIKEKASKAYNYSEGLTMEAVHKAQDIIDKYKHKLEITDLSDKRDVVLQKLGLHLYRTLKENKHNIPDNYLDDDNVKTLLYEIEEIDAKIIEINKQDSKK